MQNELKDASRNGALDLLDELIEDFNLKQDEMVISKTQLIIQLECWKNNISKKLWVPRHVR